MAQGSPIVGISDQMAVTLALGKQSLLMVAKVFTETASLRYALQDVAGDDVGYFARTLGAYAVPLLQVESTHTTTEDVEAGLTTDGGEDGLLGERYLELASSVVHCKDSLDVGARQPATCKAIAEEDAYRDKVDHIGILDDTILEE